MEASCVLNESAQTYVQEKKATHRQMCEHGECAAEEGNEVTQVVTGLTPTLSCHPIIICQLQELIDL